MRCPYLVAVGGVAVVVAALAGCSSQTGHSETGHGSGAEAAAQESTTPLKFVVDNQVRSVDNEVACVDAADIVFVNLGSDQDGIALRLSSGDSPVVKSLTLADDPPLMYNESRGGTPPTVTKSGMTYQIVGTTSRTLSGSSGDKLVKPFELEFTCPPR